MEGENVVENQILYLPQSAADHHSLQTQTRLDVESHPPDRR